MEKESFAKIFGLGDKTTTAVITKCLAAGMLMGKAEERTKMALLSNPRLTKDIRRHIISQNVGKQFPGLSEKFTADQADALIDLFAQNTASFCDWK